MVTLPCYQAQNSATFTPPPLDGSLTIPEICDHHLHSSGTHPLFIYDHDDGVHTITWRQAVQAIHTAARRLASVPTLHHAKEPPVVAIFAVIDQMSYFFITAGIMRAGYRAFPISPRNSDRGVANLLQKMHVRHLVVSKDDITQRMAKSACRLVQEDQGSLQVTLLEAPTFTDLLPDKNRDFVALPPPTGVCVNDIALVLHSSGSASFPKPIPLTHHNLIQWGSQPYYGETDLCGRILSNHSLPFFHAMGVVSLTWAAMTGVTLSNFAPRNPPVTVTPEGLLRSAISCRSRYIFCVPVFLEEWSQSKETLAQLQKFDAIIFGGAPIQKAVGDKLSRLGIPLYPFYGATELGGTCTFLPRAPPDEGWQYFTISPHSKPMFLERDAVVGVYQLLFQRISSHTPAVTNTVSEGVATYDTNDLVIRHPTNPTLLRIYGRADDQIIHSSGEKTNPVPMEIIINRHPMVQSSVIFGKERFQAGVLIEPKPEYVFDPANFGQLTLFRDAVWPSVQDANSFGPSHSRIFKEIILVAHPRKPFHYTSKGTPRRQVITQEYEKEIEQGYADLENISSAGLGTPENLDLGEAHLYICQLVGQVMDRRMKDDDDIFLLGCDSLKATWLRNKILHLLCSVNIKTEGIPLNFVYMYPTISRLSKYLSNVTSGHHSDLTEGTVELMNRLVEKYSTGFLPHKATGSNCTPLPETILLTGSTGGLGSYVLEDLILNKAVSKIYCLNRRGGVGSLERQKSAFTSRGIAVSILNSDKVVFLEGEADHFHLGLPEQQYEEVRRSITSVLHVAWRVDFNISVSSTEPLIAGTRALIDLCLASPQNEPPRFVFVSSIGVVRNWKDGVAPEMVVPDARTAVGSGYPESKWVAEQVLGRAAKQTSFRHVIVRIGQLSGARNGHWNLNEWVPGVVQAGCALGCLPDTTGYITWIPVHVAAKFLTRMRSSPFPILHLIHPNPTTWTEVFGLISKIMGVPLVPYQKWLKAFEESASSDKLPASPAQLLDFYRSANRPLNHKEDEAFGFPRLSISQAQIAAPGLLGLKKLGVGDVLSWVSYWAAVGALARARE